ncbi:nuclear transport factor 2 family protein [Streptomyces sp. 769]|uniref:nuclear transport factor 2 family protein n=1 Tax=Streptomyces sp. 769 TaxID=1262452 RepID=UPI000581BB61|nr:nuclear transport factor 2 family protein [Streptomyces sp. 769]AJC62149.1 PokC1 [Streptomyces sp. 769]
MTAVAAGGGDFDLARTHSEIQQFYALQMQHLDSGEVLEWSETFTKDATFSGTPRRPPVIGRADIAAATRRAVDAAAADGIQRRHWLGMVAVRAAADGTVHARSYATVIHTKAGSTPTVHLSGACSDVLVRSGTGWAVRSRHIVPDNLPH